MLYRLLKWYVYFIYLMPFVILFLAGSSLFKILVSPIILAIILYGPLGNYTSRVTFCTKLKRICRRAKCTCRFHHLWLGSFFFPKSGLDIEITDRRETKYSIKFFPGNMASNGIHLRSDNTVEIIRYTVIPHLGRRHAMGRVERVERSRIIQSYEKPTARSGEAILLFSPSPLQITVLDGTKLRTAGNGESYQGFEIYTARGFLDYIKRKEL